MSSSNVKYVESATNEHASHLGRRGYQLGWVEEIPSPQHIDWQQAKAAWHHMDAIMLPGLFKTDIANHEQDITQAQQLAEAVLAGEPCDALFTQAPYLDRLQPKFELLAASCDESDAQEIETLDFDVMQGDEVVAEGLWVKASWLSFEEEDASLRFRFSFGMVGYEDVAADFDRQQYAAELTEAIFPASRIISENASLQKMLCDILDTKQASYVERIIYFNAPQGGAQFHQDVERGHAGVIFAQLYGRTAWLALSKTQLIKEIQLFMNTDHAQRDYLATINDEQAWQTLVQHCGSTKSINEYLDASDNDAIEYLINRVPRFTQTLIEKGYGFILNPGDALLLPQDDVNNCCWHSVFCIDDYPGQALSFAIRAQAK